MRRACVFTSHSLHLPPGCDKTPTLPGEASMGRRPPLLPRLQAAGLGREGGLPTA